MPLIDTVRIEAPKTSQSGAASLLGAVGPAEPAAADEAAIDIDRVRPFDRDRLFRWRRRRERVAERDHAGIEGAARGRERLFGLQHDGELGEIEAADENQRSGAQLRGMGAGVGEGVADLAQRHQPEWRRQIEGARTGLPCPAALLQRHFRS